MIAEFGLAALWLAAALAALQLLAGALALTPNGGRLAAVVRPAAVVQGLLCATAFAALIWLFAQTDLSVKLVAENSHSAKPLIYKLAGTWGNHEGSMLLWVLILSVFGAMVAAFGRNLPASLRANALAVQAWVASAFYLCRRASP